MSPPKKEMSPRGDAKTLDWLNENVSGLAAEITDAQFSGHPELLRKYGPKGRQKCAEDAAYHLHYLGEAIFADSPKIFTDYIGWAKVMLCSRGIRSEDLEQSLQVMKRVLLAHAGREHRVVKRFLDIALQMLPHQPETLPTFIEPTRPFAAIANRYLHSLLLLDRAAAIESVIREVEAGLSIKNVFQHVIFAAQQEVGRLWQMNQITVVQEHYCTVSADLLVARLRRMYVGTSRSVSALALCSANEEHSLGMRLLAELLEADGWKVDYIGSKSPTADVLKHLKANPTDLVAISVGTPLSFSKTKELIQSIRSSPLRFTPRILVGGAALNASEPSAVAALGADAFGKDILNGLEIANRLVAERRP